MAAYFASLNPTALWNALPGGLAQGLIWGIMALGVYMTFRILNFADMTVDGSFALGGAVCVMMILQFYFHLIELYHTNLLLKSAQNR